MTGPTSMFVIGMVIAGTSLKDIFGCRRAYAIAAGRLIFCPLVMIALLFFAVEPNPEAQSLFCTAYGAIITYFFTKRDQYGEEDKHSD